MQVGHQNVPFCASGEMNAVYFCVAFNAIFLVGVEGEAPKSMGKLDIRGHMQPIGNQGPVRKGEIAEFDTMIHGTAFYRDFFRPAVPVVFRGVIKNTQACARWINETYMRKLYGSERGMVDHRKVWGRGGVEAPPRSVMNFSDFLNRFTKEDLYWDHMIPYNHVLMRDLPFPLALNCAETRASIQYVNLMTSSGGVSYVFHRDPTDNLFHLISGEKTWLIANRTFSEEAYIGENVQFPTFSPVNPDAVDLTKYPKFSEIEFHEVKVQGGDILYVPREWPHYVTSHGSPNIGVNVWFGSELAMDVLPEKPRCSKQIQSARSLLSGMTT